MTQYNYTVIVERDEDDMYVASCPALQGCYTQGETYEEAMENIKDAIRLHIHAREDLGEPIPIEETIEKVEIIEPDKIETRKTRASHQSA